MAIDMNLYHVSPFQTHMTEQTDTLYTYYDLEKIYNRRAVYSPLVRVLDTGTPTNAESVEFSDLIPPKPDISSLNPYTLMIPSSRFNSARIRVDFDNYGGKLSFHKEDNQFVAWKRNNVAGLLAIVQQGLGQMAVDQMDLLARNAFLQNPVKSFGDNKTSFAGLTTTDTLNAKVTRNIGLDLKERHAFWQNIATDMSPNNMICITTHGAILDMIDDLHTQTGNIDPIPVERYTLPPLPGEVFTYNGVRFIESNMGVLWNSGPIAQRKTITAPQMSGDGTPDPNTTTVDGKRYIGQRGVVGQKHYIQLDTVTGLAVGDKITIHKAVTSAFGVTDGVDWRDNYTFNVNIVGIDAPNNRITIALPLPDDYTTDLGGGVYGYLTKGRHVHSSVFIGGNEGIVLALARAIQFYTPPSIDDFDSMKRFTFDWRGKYNVFYPEDVHVHFHAGSNSVNGVPVVS